MKGKKDATKDEPKTYASFGGVLAAQSRRTLPRGTKARIRDDNVEIVKGENVLCSVDLADFAIGELKRHGFKVIDYLE